MTHLNNIIIFWWLLRFLHFTTFFLSKLLPRNVYGIVLHISSPLSALSQVILNISFALTFVWLCSSKRSDEKRWNKEVHLFLFKWIKFDWCIKFSFFSGGGWQARLANRIWLMPFRPDFVMAMKNFLQFYRKTVESFDAISQTETRTKKLKAKHKKINTSSMNTTMKKIIEFKKRANKIDYKWPLYHVA